MKNLAFSMEEFETRVAKVKEAIRRLPDSLIIWNLQPAASGSTAHPLN